MEPLSYDGRRFRVVTRAANGDAGPATEFVYRQRGDVVWATYEGGRVRFGTLVAAVEEDGVLDARYAHVGADGEVRTGTCRSTPEALADGRLRLHEVWQWTSGDESSGESVVEEVAPPSSLSAPRAFTSGVSVVMVGTSSAPVGMSIAWLTQVERDHVAVSLPRGARGTDRVISTDRFTLSLLSESQMDIARRYGGGRRKVDGAQDHLIETDWDTPVVRAGCAAYLCRVVGAQTVREQVVVTARIVKTVYAAEASPLLYRPADYA